MQRETQGAHLRTVQKGTRSATELRDCYYDILAQIYTQSDCLQIRPKNMPQGKFQGRSNFSTEISILPNIEYVTLLLVITLR